MSSRLSSRLVAVVSALPFRPDSRILEIGCGPGAAAREIANQLTSGHILATDRSATAISQARFACANEIAGGQMSVRQVAAEDFELVAGEAPFDMVFAIRVGALDGRHPELELAVLARIAAATRPHARLFIDGGDPLREVAIPRR